ncbi:MAG: Nudix family hydrolase [Pseudohongiella sp.]|uniref:Nudix family hydrolase n=1 Tax=Pseudohongiella sp. TaxID=1979412 RepID=UPI00349FEFD6
MTDGYNIKRIHVAVGVILDSQGQVLVARRADNQHLGGLWEFPGGKLEAGESVEQALCRELREELDIAVECAQPFCRIEHDYPDKAVLLDVWLVERFSGTPTGQENQPLRWLPVAQLDTAEFPQANRFIIRRLQLRDFLAIINLPTPLAEAPTFPRSTLSGSTLSGSTLSRTLLRLRCQHKDQYPEYLSAAQQALQSITASKVGVIVDLAIDSINEHGRVREEISGMTGIRGLHAHAPLLHLLAPAQNGRPVPEHLLFGVSCHSRQELELAAQLDADYILLSPVLTTASHPGTTPLGWDTFETMIRETDVPVYALGGMRPQDLDIARTRGARGIAGISMLSALATTGQQ